MLFIDPACPAPYSAATLASGFLGGTEATVVRLLSAMPEGAVMQHNRSRPEGDQYRPLDWKALAQNIRLVVMRDLRTALELRQAGWRGPLFLWLHDLMDTRMALALPHAYGAGIELIAVSNWHRSQILGLFRATAGPLAPAPVVHVIYNPVDPTIQASTITPDPNRLISISTVHKGVYDVLAHFQILRSRYPQLELHLTDSPQPGFQAPGVKVLGLMPHAQAMHALAGAFCMFCPNTSQPETFGIVFAEASALGVPTLAHDFGAASEILDDPRQLINAYHPTELVDRFENWRRNGRPQVRVREAFRLSNVVQSWRALAA